ncbi:MAG TPA: Bax inhibitor-1/YccA family protein [Alphaproteobacteria bacterium]|nr:Bax inhibitor-1/YccA family protein [Alphaproteobacteria bacterium]
MDDKRYAASAAAVKSREGATVDRGLQAYMQKVYNMMAFGLVVTGFVSWVTYQTPALFEAIHGSWIGLVVALSPLAILFFGLTPSRVSRMSVGGVAGIYVLLTALIGLSLSYIFAVYSGESIARVFFITAGMFAATSIYGYTTKRDLSAMGSMMVMAVIGIIIASLVNLFLQSSAMAFAISVIGVIAFTGLTAWDTQRIKETYSYAMAQTEATKLAIMGALSLYLDFINLFQFLLHLLGNRE